MMPASVDHAYIVHCIIVKGEQQENGWEQDLLVVKAPVPNEDHATGNIDSKANCTKLFLNLQIMFTLLHTNVSLTMFK